MDLTKTTAFVSGANRGLGRHLAEQLISRGARVYGGARKPETIDTATGVVPVKLDITDHASVTAAAAAASDTTLLINNAGVLTATSLLTGDLRITRPRWHRRGQIRDHRRRPQPASTGRPRRRRRSPLP